MSTLSGKLLNIYNQNDSLSKVIDDIDFLSVCKKFLIYYVGNESLRYFHPFKFEKFSGFNKDLSLEILFTLSTNDLILEKNYAFDCDSCGNPIIEKKMDDIFFCRNIECDFVVPEKGNPLFEFIKENVYYQFSISERLRPLIVEEAEKSIPPLSSFPNQRNGKEDKTKVKAIFNNSPIESEVFLMNTEGEKLHVEDYAFDLEDAL